MEHPITLDGLLQELCAITALSDARALVRRASRVAGVSAGCELRLPELLLVCEALSAEGGQVQTLAEAIAMRVAHEDAGGDVA